MTDPALLARVAAYYTGKLQEHGATARGVDWPSDESQALRFSQLLRLCDGAAAIDIADLGCGYGALVDVLKARGTPFSYAGYDVSEAMVAAARQRHAGEPRASFHAGRDLQPADFVVASGIFNVRMQHGEAEWVAYIEATLEAMHAAAQRGFAFNMLTSYSDAERMRPDLYYGEPEAFFALCKRRYSRNVALLHDYGLYEFTILVRKG